MKWISVLQNIYELFPTKSESLSRFSGVENRLQKMLGLTRVAFMLRHDKGLRTVDGRNPLNRLKLQVVLKHLTRSLKPWICAPKDGFGWLGFWPVVREKELLGCWGFKGRRELSLEEVKLIELLSDRTAFYLEQRRLWECLETAQEQTSMNFRSSALIHEIRNALTTLSTLVQLLPEKKGDKAFLDTFEMLTSREINRLIGLTQNRPNCEGMARMELGGVLNHVTQLMGPLFKTKRARLNVKNTPGLFFNGNEPQIESLVLNLLQNALEASSEKVEVSTTDLGPQPNRSGRWIELKVKDNGKGIAADQLKKIFDPYFSTKVQGTGLGLAVCQRVVENHGGHIKVRSSKRGTQFQILLPA